jgi:thiamine kinase-like enzyme
MKKFLVLLLFHSIVWSNPLKDEVVQGFFKEEVTFEPIYGGYEATSYLILAGSKKYVLRLFNPHQPEELSRREIYAMQEFAKIGISPKVFYITSNGLGVLMDFIEGGTSTINQAKQAENRVLMAEALRKIHSTEKHQVSSDKAFLKRSEDFYRQIKKRCASDPEPDRAMAFILAQLAEFDHTPKANLHGDLIPHNIFYTKEGVKLIDWTYTRWDDPFFDLSYYAFCHTFNAEEELHLLTEYLMRAPTEEEIKRYILAKQMNAANLYLNIYNYVCEQLEENPDQQVDFSATPQSWNYYMEQFGVKGASFNLQFFYEWAMSATYEY